MPRAARRRAARRSCCQVPSATGRAWPDLAEGARRGLLGVAPWLPRMRSEQALGWALSDRVGGLRAPFGVRGQALGQAGSAPTRRRRPSGTTAA